MRVLVIAFFAAASLTTLAWATDVHVRVSPDIKTGTEAVSEFPTIQMALDHHPNATPNRDGSPGRVFLHIAPGIYHERIVITQNHPNITLIGTGSRPQDVVITNSFNAKQAGGTFLTATVTVESPGFEAANLTFENSAGNTGQAVAIAVRSDRAIFKHCRFLGDQDTLFADFGRQYYLDSYITGGVDFIFGNATAVFDRTEIHEIRPAYLTAQSRTAPDQTTGYVILNSRVTSAFVSTDTPSARQTFFLGRPWRPYSRVVVMNTELPANLDPAGWSLWSKTDTATPAFYAEFKNTGPGAAISARVPWSHQLTPREAAAYLPASFLNPRNPKQEFWDAETEAAKLP
ncbi:pectinesterase family protein [Granulicella sp. dw_53]|uniref:pectinesterase family protein n=1 Tax=Granulicella sp. dw_53 TaxID=2719792 RepID=UPI001BD21C89|nr:pectinesterase family protein [Granulicella sp. dw_53]